MNSNRGKPADVVTPILNRFPRTLRGPLDAVDDAVHVDVPIKKALARPLPPHVGCSIDWSSSGDRIVRYKGN
jgi:hypothetical protein